MFAALIAAVVIAAPAGFTENPTLDARASYIAQKQVQVFCANDAATWSTFLETNSVVAPNGIANGYTPTIAGAVTYLAPDTCAPILTRLARQTPKLGLLGATLDTLTHESIHMRGTADEGQTECDAISTLPAYLVAKWGFKKNTVAWRSVMYGAINYHKRLPSQYRTVC